jgi:hypothetical protein
MYKKRVYSMTDFMRFDKPVELSGVEWHGYSTDSNFSSVLVALSDCGSTVKVGTCLS